MVDNPNDMFKDCVYARLEPPWEPFWDCASFATDDCKGDCNNCTIPKDLLTTAK